MSRGSRRRFLVGILFVGALALAAGAFAAPAAASAPSEAVGTGPFGSEQQTAPSVDDLDGERYWVGQELEIDGFDDGETVTFEHEDRFLQQTADDGTVRTPTDGWAVGEWTVDGDDSNVSGTFTLSEQELETVAFESEHAAEDATLRVESNRARFVLALSSDDLETDELAGIVDGAEVVNDRAVVVVDDAEAAIDVDVSDLQGGVYDLKVDVLDTTATGSATLEVSSGLEFEGYYPMPYEGSDRYWDVTGDRSVTTLDLQAFFQHQHRHDVFDDHPEKFDFSDNGEVGQPDVVALFHALGDVPTGENGDDPHAEFVDGPFSVAEGDVARIDVDVTDADDAWVEVSLEDFDYAATVELEDLDDPDGTVTIEANTHELGHQTGSAFTGEHVADYEESGDLLERMQRNDNRFVDGFSFRLHAGTGAPSDGPDDVTRLRLNERWTGDVTVYQAPAGTDLDVDSIHYLLEDATETDVVAEGDVLLAQVEASGVTGYLGDEPSTFDVAGEDLQFTFESESEGPFGPSDTVVELEDVEEASIHVDEQNEQFVVALDTAAVQALDVDQEWEAVFEVGPDNAYTDESEVVIDDFGFEERSLEFVGEFDDEDRLLVPRGEDSQITLETNAAPGATATYYAETQDDTYSDDITVTDDGTISLPLGIGQRAEVGEILPVIDVSEDGGESVATEGLFVDADGPLYSVDASSPGEVIVGENATLDVVVENAGYQTGTVELSAAIDGQSVNEISGSFAPEQTLETTYSLPTDEPGNVTWDLETQTDSSSGTLVVSEDV